MKIIVKILLSILLLSIVIVGSFFYVYVSYLDKPLTSKEYCEISDYRYRIISTGLNQKYSFVELFLQGAKSRSDYEIVDFIKLFFDKKNIDFSNYINVNNFQVNFDTLDEFYIRIFSTNYIDVSEHYDDYNVRLKVRRKNNKIYLNSLEKWLHNRSIDTSFVVED